MEKLDEEYDAIVLGTGLKECILSGILSVDGLKVLHIDRNNFYGGESASLNLQQFYERFKPGQEPSTSLGPSRDYNIDMIPKFIMANGQLVKILIHTGVTKYLDFKAVDGSYVLKSSKIHKVPATDGEALRSPLMGLFEKRRARKFFIYVQNYEEKDFRTHDGMDLKRVTMKDVFEKFSLDENTIDFIGHALALHRNDKYLAEPALPTVLRIKLYAESLARYDTGSPYLYPLYGLGELPQAFARLSAVYGGTYMLGRPDVEVVYESDGVASGVKVTVEDGQGPQIAKAKFVVGDSSYFPGKTQTTGKVVRAIAIMSHPIPNTSDSHSVQIILPQKQTGRHSDIYVFCCSYSHHVAPKGKYIAFVSTNVETENPRAELAPGLALLGLTDDEFYEVYETLEPMNDGKTDKCFISKTYDATSHFETTVDDVFDMYFRITGKPLDLSRQDPTTVGSADN